MAELEQGSVSSQEKGYAADAMANFNNKEYNACLSALEMLEVSLILLKSLFPILCI